MTYQDTIDWLFAQLPMYQNQGKFAYKADLRNIEKLAAHLGDPHHKFKAVHVAGTNGKGSTSHMIASVLQEAGYSVGLYTSPHLKDFRERIRIGGQMISKQYVIGFFERNKAFFEAEQLSFFEMTVGLAFEYFARKKVDIAVVEVGLGGILDSTNIITPEVSVITNIGYDHMNILGNTLAKIASSKAGIIKPKVPVVISEYQEETIEVFVAKAKECNAEIYMAEDYMDAVFKDQSFTTDLKGSYQAKNIKAAITALDVLGAHASFGIHDSSLVNGLNKVVANTGLLGRWQVLQGAPKVICDTAHNTEGLTETMQQLVAEEYRNLHIVLGVVRGKNLEKTLPLLPKDARYYYCAPSMFRALPVATLAMQAEVFGLKGCSFASVQEAYKSALKQSTSEDVIYVGGSTFVVAEVI